MKNFLRGVLWVWRSRFAKSEKRAVLLALYRVKFAASKKHGICGEVSKRGGYNPVIMPELQRLFSLWPKYSGDQTFPIPGGYVAYQSAAWSTAMWSGEYGALRKELLNFMIEQLEKELAE